MKHTKRVESLRQKVVNRRLKLLEKKRQVKLDLTKNRASWALFNMGWRLGLMNRFHAVAAASRFVKKYLGH